MYSSSQTPIGILQETATKKGLLVHYELIANEGEAHEPIYVYQCRVGKITAFGKGASKKKAKHLAAYYVLLKLIGDDPPAQNDRVLLQSMRTSLSFLGVDIGDPLAANCEEVNAAATRAPINYVSRVQEYCDKSLWPPPVYEFLECPPSLFGSKYHCKVRLWRWEFSGFGSSKKEAKRKAAAEFLKEVVEQGLSIPPDALEALEEENLPLVEKQDLNKLKVKQNSQEVACKLARKILSGVCTTKGKLKEMNIKELIDPSFDVYEALKRSLDENNISVFYSYTTNTKSSAVYCQAQLSTIPPQVTCSRPHTSIVDARKDAAYRCLVYLHTMTKPNPSLCEDLWF